MSRNPSTLSAHGSTAAAAEGRAASRAASLARRAPEAPADANVAPDPVTEPLGQYLKTQRERRGISVAELARVTRIPASSLEAIEADRFDELPGEVFVRGFLGSYARAVRVLPAEVVARYMSSRRVAYVTPLPMQTPLQAAREGQGGRRFGVAIAFVLLLILLSLALSIVLKPRGRDMPAELSQAASRGMNVG
ncbi:MAG TPA: helix-turn-helix transcriptional regulator [Polyangiaceae bacterium]